LIIVDALRADHLGCYGYYRNTSPAIDELADNGVIFSNCLAQWPTSTPSHASIFTSTYPHTHLCFQNGAKLNSNMITIAEVLRKQGYLTAAFIANSLISKGNNFSQGFDFFHSSNYFDLSNFSPKFIFHSLSIMRILDKALKINTITIFTLDWFERNQKEKIFLVMQYIEPHRPYVSHEGFDFQQHDIRNHSSSKHGNRDINDIDAKRRVALYDGEIAYIDAEIRKIIDKLDELGTLDNTVIIITADHGENLFDHKPYFRHSTLYDSSIKIPLIFYLKDKIEPIKINEVVESIDIAPTILELLDIPSVKQYEGKSLLPNIRGFSPPLSFHGFSEEIKPHIRKVCIRTQDWKLIMNFEKDDVTEEFYNVQEDPFEKRNIVDNEGVSAILREELIQWIRGSKNTEKYFLKFEQLPKTIFTKKTLRDLKSLGYIN